MCMVILVREEMTGQRGPNGPIVNTYYEVGHYNPMGGWCKIAVLDTPIEAMKVLRFINGGEMVDTIIEG